MRTRASPLQHIFGKARFQVVQLILPGFIVESVKGFGVCDGAAGSSNCA